MEDVPHLRHFADHRWREELNLSLWKILDWYAFWQPKMLGRGIPAGDRPTRNKQFLHYLKLATAFGYVVEIKDSWGLTVLTESGKERHAKGQMFDGQQETQTS